MDNEPFVHGEGLLYQIEANEIRQDTAAIHGDYIDEGAIDEDDFKGTFQSEESEVMDWRKGAVDFKKRGRKDRPDFSRFFANDWRHARVAAKHLKFCPGEFCKSWQPLHNFGANMNMPDHLDVYCISCNQTKRQQRRDKEAPVVKQRHTGPVPDKYELFNKVYKMQAPQKDLKTIREQAIWREVKKRIARAAMDAQTRYNTKLPIDPTDVARRLFQGKKFICNVTGQVLTLECFLEHHVLTFEVSDGKPRRMDIICSQCRKGEPPKNA